VRPWFVVAVIGLAGCSSSPTVVTPAPIAAPAAVAEAFMQAVADSNMTHMAELWGTARGAAAATNTPNNWPQRISVIHAYLKGGTSRILGEDPAMMTPARRRILVELSRSGCIKTVPFTMVRTKQGSWLVNAIDLSAAGVPGRPCEPTRTSGAAASRDSLGELDEDAGRRLRMEEGDPFPAGSGPRGFVNESIPRRSASIEGIVQVVDPIADGVGGGRPPGQKPGDRPVGSHRLEQLDLGVAEGE